VVCVAEMVESMKKVAKLDVELTVEERNLLSVGYKNVIGARRASWRIMSSIEQKEESKGNEQNVKRIKEYRHKVEEELSKICNDILTIIDEHLIPSSSTGESTVFYYKMYVSSWEVVHDEVLSRIGCGVLVLLQRVAAARSSPYGCSMTSTVVRAHEFGVRDGLGRGGGPELVDVVFG
jgi:hypothetical protein